MKTTTASILLRSLSFVGLLACAFMTPVQAQLSEAAQPDEQSLQWAKLKRGNAAVEACHVVWHRVNRKYAQPDADPEQQAQGMMKSARERGLDEQKVTQLGEMQRRKALRSQQEKVVESTLDFVRIGNSVLCNAVYTTPAYSQRFIEFYDGTFSLHALNEFQGEIRRPDGALTRDPKEILYMSAFGPQVARFLLAIPFDQEFSPDNPSLWQQDAKLQELPNGEWSITRDARFIKGKSQDPSTLIFGGDGAYLSSYEKLYIKSLITDKEHKITKINYKSGHKIVATQFKQYADGIWFPSKIVETSPNDTTEYTMIEAQFNEDVNPLGLTLPPDLRVADTRFGMGRNMVVYNTTDGRLLTDEEVKMKMVRRRTQKFE